ncbi:MAG: hypothetical protein M1820_004019 [Bogoriella megaspora]|nr:MAG: hypothetical protein M1820_004019 [Bogoriella megaspora]
MASKKFERLQALLGDDQLPGPMGALSLSEGTRSEFNPPQDGVFRPEFSSLAGYSGKVEDLEIIVSDSEDDELYDPQYQPPDLAQLEKNKRKKQNQARKSRKPAAVVPGVDTPGHQWTHDPTRITKISNSKSKSKSGSAAYQHFDLDPRRGVLSTPGDWFCPIVALSKYPYTFVNESASQPIASAFFDNGKFWLREWELYYVHPPFSLAQKPVILVPLHQLKTLLSDINATFINCGLEVSSDFYDIGFVTQFPDHPDLRPRFIGVSTSKAHFAFLELHVPPQGTMDTPGDVAPADDRSLEAFKNKVQRMIEINRGRRNANKAKKKEQRIQRQQDIARSLKRTQRYLGLRPKSQQDSKLSFPRFHDMSDIGNQAMPTTQFDTWEDEKEAFAQISEQSKLPPIDVEQPPPYQFDSAVIFVCIDVEVCESDHKSITEIGVSTLDTLDLIGVAPRKHGINWEPKIQKHHFRIAENAHMVNYKHVAGCPDRFEFGESQFISINDAPAILTQILAPSTTLPSSERALHYTPPRHAPASSLTSRNVVIVGHDIQSDLAYLGTLSKDFDPLFPTRQIGIPQTSPVMDVLDTAAMDRVSRHEQQPRQLAMLLVEYDITGWNLHNAGNDAAYTLHAMLALTLKAAESRKAVPTSTGNDTYEQMTATLPEALNPLHPGSGQATDQVAMEGAKEHENESALWEKIRVAQVEAERKVREAEEGWESDEGDGGAPLPPSQYGNTPLLGKEAACEEEQTGTEAGLGAEVGGLGNVD